MTYAGNWKTLLGGSRGEQRSGTAEQDLLQFACLQLIKQVTAERDGAAAAAGSAGMDILFGIIKHQRAAVGDPSAQI